MPCSKTCKSPACKCVLKAVLAGIVNYTSHCPAQLTSPVQWEKSMNLLLGSGLEQSYEIGPNKVLAGIFKRIDKKHKISNIQV
jgi:malonyl CoA-acyl carrier protein transacylase